MPSELERLQEALEAEQTLAAGYAIENENLRRQLSACKDIDRELEILREALTTSDRIKNNALDELERLDRLGKR